jgi:hypothetical protein
MLELARPILVRNALQRPGELISTDPGRQLTEHRSFFIPVRPIGLCAAMQRRLECTLPCSRGPFDASFREVHRRRPVPLGQASRNRQVTTAMALAVVPGGNDRKESADGKRDSLRFWCGH